MTPTPRGAAADAPETGPAERSAAAFALILALAAAVFAALVALGTWQVHRLAWKHALMARVAARVDAAPVAPPDRARWPDVTATSNEYRHVRVSGTFLDDRETLVQAATELGAGFWVMTPLRTAAGDTILVNRGFVPAERRAASTHASGATPTTVTGLLRLSEPKGGFLRRNDPGADRWFSRDVAAIAAARGLTNAAPYFIDADATPNPGGYPVGGLTVVSFADNHLVYAITWYVLAAMVAGAIGILVRDRLRRRGRVVRRIRPVSRAAG